MPYANLSRNLKGLIKVNFHDATKSETLLHELVLVGLNIGGNVFIWKCLLPERKILAVVIFLATVIAVCLLAERWHIDLSTL